MRHLSVNKDEIVRFCRKHRIRRLALFGSVTRKDFGPHSDVDVLVEFDAGYPVGLIRMAGIERELSGILGRKADLRTPAELSRYFREDVIRTAEVLYAA
ncbi:MAG: nucleotidyltransferase domain-containing protein [Deltaproteobacteria bacterium]|nr:nucleotidyltransferase domain-containing protein [Deltaproteobacteria bacterium]